MQRAGGKDSHPSTCATQTFLRHTREHLSRGTQTIDPDGRRLCLFDMPLEEPHSNQVASAPITVPPRRNDTDLTLSSAATAEMDDVLLVGGEIARSSTAAYAPAETASAIRALKALTETSLLAAQQSNDILPKQIIMSGVE